MRYAVMIMADSDVKVTDEYLPKTQARRQAGVFNRICNGTGTRAMAVPQPLSRAIRRASLKSRSA